MKEFNRLINLIKITHSTLQQHAVNAVNQSLTIRNWLIGLYIVEYEQRGKDRAEYGKKLLPKLSEKLKEIKGMDERSLRNFRQFYLIYPQIGNYIEQTKIWGAVSPKLLLSKRRTLSPEFKTASDNTLNVSSEKIISRLSYSHLELLFKINDNLKRTFYELETIKNTWSVRELKRQINTLYYERSALSEKPEKLSKLVNRKIIPETPTDIIKNIYSFEFLDLRINEVVEESDMETALLDTLEEFILELGTGFCFEARQKRILIGEKYYFIDLVFYHRILKCHVLIELKLGEFEHGDIGQLNTYLNFYKENICQKKDNPPVGILLVAEKNSALVKYATAGMDKNLFVKQYLVNLPSPEKLKNYIEKELMKL
jgi:predicted nuclease of restriction endonuclease-like (RecB) superfamily